MHNAGMIYRYARVSTLAQDLAASSRGSRRQDAKRVSREKITGTIADRPQLKKLMAVLAHDDVVIIPAVDRLSRDTTDLLAIPLRETPSQPVAQAQVKTKAKKK